MRVDVAVTEAVEVEVAVDVAVVVPIIMKPITIILGKTIQLVCFPS